MARPRPRVAPVTSVTRPDKSNISRGSQAAASGNWAMSAGAGKPLHSPIVTGAAGGGRGAMPGAAEKPLPSPIVTGAAGERISPLSVLVYVLGRDARLQHQI